MSVRHLRMSSAAANMGKPSMTYRRVFTGRRALLALATCCCMQWAMAQSLDTQRQYDLPAGRLVDALNVLSEQSGLQIVYDAQALSGQTTAALRGAMTAEQALRTLLQRRGLVFEQVSERTVRVRRAATARPAEPKARAEPAEEEPVTLPELLVRGSRSLNADIRRRIHDPQPYVVFDRTAIERAGALNLDRKSVVQGKSGAVRVVLGGDRRLKKKK